MKGLALLVSLVLLPGVAGAQHEHPGSASAPAPALAGLGGLHHPVSTRSADAQRFFDQGICLSFAFNHDEAFRAFQQAARLDPGLGMACWGMALVLGPNINFPIDEPRSKQAYDLVQKALELSRSA